MMQQEAKRWSGYQWTILILMTSAFMLGFIDRVNLSIVVPVWIQKYHFNAAQAGFVLSIFSWAYAVGLFFAGPVADRWHQKRVLPLGMTLWTAATWLTALALSTPLFTFTRSLLGLGESTIIPSCTRTLSEIYEKKDYGKAVGIFYAGSELGLAVGAPISAFILSRLGWQAVFLVTGAFSLIWLLIWLPIYRPDKNVIAEELPDQARQPEDRSVKWLSLLKYRQTWGLMIGQFAALYILYVYVTWVPSLLVLQHHFSILSAGWFTSLIFVASVAMIIFGGWVSDFWMRHGGDITLVRKALTCGGMLMATVFIVLAAYVQSQVLTIITLMLSIGGFGLLVPSIGILSIDLAPRHNVASLIGLQTFLGNIGSAVAPLITGFLFASTGNFQLALLITGAICLVFGIGGFGLLLGKVEKTVGVTPANSQRLRRFA
jgi:ACS family D-galactonate transporter-like MFS transporter